MTEAAAPNPAGRRLGAARLLSDDRLARRAAKGDRRALEEIYSRYQQDLYRFCLAMVGNPQDAQDALQNTMVKVLRALPGEERRIQLKPWLYRIARNESVETIRKRRPSAELKAEETPSAEAIPETVEARERLRELIGDLCELPERQRAALVMRELAGLGFAQIGAAFDSSAAVARQTVYEARLSLRQMEAGREMTCEAVMQELSESDGRVTRRRELRAHLRNCADCRAFRKSIANRRGDLAAIAPLPAVASAALLNGVLGGSASAAVGGAAAGASAGAAGGGLAGAVGAGAGKAVATSAIVKSAATVAVVAVVGVSAADRGGLIEVPLPVKGGGDEKSTPVVAPATPASAEGADGSAPKGGTAATANEQAGGKRGADRRGDGAPGRSKAAKRPGRSRSKQGKAHRGRRNGMGHGRARGKGRPDGLPPASSHGQQRAGAHKAPQARAVPGPGGSARGNGSAGTGPPASKPSKPQSPPPATSPPSKEAPAPSPSPPIPPVEAPAADGSATNVQGKGNPGKP